MVRLVRSLASPRRLSQLAGCSFTLALAFTITGSSDAAGPAVPRPARLEAPGKSLAATDDADATGSNPSSLAFLPAWQATYLHQHLSSEDEGFNPGHGDALGFAMPLLFGVSAGARVESIRPPDASGSPDVGSLTIAVAYRISDTLSAAFDLRRWYASTVPSLDGSISVGASVSWRPSRYLGVALVGRDLNAPLQSSGTVAVTRSLQLGVAVRPLGTRALEIGLESTIWQHRDQRAIWEPRATLGVDIPSVGRALASFRIQDDVDFGFKGGDWAFTGGVEIAWDGLRVGGGVLAHHDEPRPGWYASASIAGYTQKPSLPSGSRAVTIRIEETPGAHGHVRLLRKLARLGRDSTVRAVALILKAEPASSTAHAEELSDALKALQAHGIKVLCHLETAGGKALVACSTADRISIQPAGGIRFAGLRFESMYYGEALRKLGVEPDFVRIKEHKSAAEAFVRSGPTDVARSDERELLAGLENIYIARIGTGRRIAPDALRAILTRGPFVADEAIAAGLVDDKAFDDEERAKIQAVVGAQIPVVEDSVESTAPRSFGPQPKIAVVYLDGDIVDGRSQTIPILNIKTAGSYTVVDALKAARENPDVQGVILRIESPGGSSMASDLMWREAELLAKAKPTVVSMGSVAASGGYYAAAFGAPIYANEGTITGSIGIFYGKADLSGLLGKLGVHVVTEKTAPRADAESLYRAFTDEERVELLHKVEQFYAVFLDRISRGRHLDVEAIDAVGRGKVWLGAQAKERKLVDVVGGFDVALRDLRERLALPEDVAIAEYPQEKAGILELAFSLLGVKAPSPESAAEVQLLTRALAPFASALVPFVLYRSDEPLALWEGAEKAEGSVATDAP